jgi:Fe-S-cluster containining protein
MTEHDRETCPSHELRDHNLEYLPHLKVGEELFTRRFEGGCSMMKCNGFCCREGVIIDSKHKDLVLENADIVKRYMDETQTQDTSLWFEPGEEVDIDFPSGKSVNTAKYNDVCVFLDKQKLCVLQKAEGEVPNLKPYYCRTYPIVIIDSRLTYDDEHSPSETHCCGPVKEGPLNVFDICSYELEYALGPSAKGLKELKALAAEIEKAE